MVQRLLAALLLAGATAQSTEGGVFVLTDGTAKSFIDSKPITLVHYYAQWCAKCKTLAPKLEKVAEKAKAKGWPIAIAKVDAKEQEEAAKDVYGYPTLKIFHGKDSSEYEGPREVDDIMKYLERLVTSQTLPTMKAPADLTKLAKAGKEPVVLGLFREPVKASAAYKTFKEAAFEFHGQGVKFAYSAGATNPPVAPLNAAGKKPTVPGLVLMDAKGEKATQGLPVPRKKDDFTLDAIKDWLGSHGMSVSVPEKPGYQDKEYSDPADTSAADDEEGPHYDDD